MSKPVGVYINFQQDHELDYGLIKLGCRTTQDNRDVLVKLSNQIKQFFKLKSSDNLKWVDFFAYFKGEDLEDLGLELKA